MYIYQVKGVKVDPEHVLETVNRFNIDGEFQSQDDTYIVCQGMRTLVIYKSSEAIYYGDFSKLHQPDYRPELVSNKEAEKIAIDYLKRNGWWSETAILDRITEGRFDQSGSKDHDQPKVHPNHTCLEFRFSRGQMKTYGPGAKIKVFLGHKGEIIGLFKASQGHQKYADCSSISETDLIEVLRHKLDSLLEKISVGEMKLSYLNEPPVLNGRIVQPVFVITLSAPIISERCRELKGLEFMTHPLPATASAPIALIEAPGSHIEIKHGETLSLSCKVIGGAGPFKFLWESDIDGQLSNQSILKAGGLSVSHREGHITSHTIKVTVIDRHGNQDTHQVEVKVYPGDDLKPDISEPADDTSSIDPDDPFVSVECCSLYRGSTPDITGTDASV